MPWLRKWGPVSSTSRCHLHILRPLDQLHAMDLDALEDFNMLDGTFFYIGDFYEEGPIAKVAIDQLRSGKDSGKEGYAFEEKDDYLNQLEVALVEPEPERW